MSAMASDKFDAGTRSPVVDAVVDQPGSKVEDRAPVGQSAVSFKDLVTAELRLARQLYPARDRHLEAAAYIREKFEDYWQAVKVRVLGRDVRPLLRSLVQLAAMAQRAAEDLRLAERACGVALSFQDQVTDKLPDLRWCLHRPLKTSHAAATWLRFAVDRYESAVEVGVPHKSPQLVLEQLVILAGCCRVVAEDLHYLERADGSAGPPESTAPALQLEAECSWCHSRDTARQLYNERGPALNEWRCRTCGRTFYPVDLVPANGALERA